mgnify:CR=1 FL=1
MKIEPSQRKPCQRSVKKTDARFQTVEQLHERRKQVVQLNRQKVGVMCIVELTGLSYPTVLDAIDRYDQGGVTGDQARACGWRGDEGCVLADEGAL